MNQTASGVIILVLAILIVPGTLVLCRRENWSPSDQNVAIVVTLVITSVLLIGTIPMFQS